MKLNSKNQGFTLLEAIVAIAILLVAVTSASGLILSSLQNVHVTKNRVVAAYLAQEGIEVVRAIRDTSWINGLDYNANLTPSPTPYCAQYDSTVLTSGPCDYNIYWDGTNPAPAGAYTHDSSAEPTIFTREILITALTNPENDPTCVGPDPAVLQVLSTVSWSGPSAGSITVEDRLYDWLQSNPC